MTELLSLRVHPEDLLNFFMFLSQVVGFWSMNMSGIYCFPKPPGKIIGSYKNNILKGKETIHIVKIGYLK